MMNDDKPADKDQPESTEQQEKDQQPVRTTPQQGRTFSGRGVEKRG